MALCLHQVRIFWGIAIRSDFAVKLGVFQSQLVIAVSAFAILLAPFKGFELGTNARLTSLIVPELFHYFRR